MDTLLQRSLDRTVAALGAALVVATGVVFVACGGESEVERPAPPHRR